MSDITSGAPQLVLLGTDDRSRQEEPRSVPLRPTHFPLSYFYAQRGPAVVRAMANGDQALYGADTFNPLKPYYNHSTVFLQGFLGKGNAVMAERVIPDDAPPPSAGRFVVEVLKTKREIYERNSDGSIKYLSGAPVSTGVKIDGHRVRFSVVPIPDSDVDGFANGTVKPGTLTDADATGTSEIIPLWDIKESSIGKDGDLTSFNVYGPTRTTSDVSFDPRMLSRLRSYPMVFRVGRQTSATASPQPVTTLTSTKAILATTQQGDQDQDTGQSLHLVDVLLKSYQRLNHKTLPDVYGNVGNIAVYQSNINRLVEMVYEAEADYIRDNMSLLSNYDFLLDGQPEAHLVNFLGGVSYNGYPYHSYTIEPATSGFKPTPSQWANLQGGGDGTMDDEKFAALVEAKIAEYANNFSPAQDDARRVESVFYDSGFPMETKYKLLDFFAIRKDLAVALSTFVAGDGKVTAAQDYARAAALRTRALLYPESVFFGTPVARATIWGRSGLLAASNYTKRVPGLYEFAMKCATFMGAGNRVWRTDKQPTGYPNSLVTELTDVDVTFTPVDQRVQDWEVGLNWIQAYDQRDLHIPAYKTVYSDDTSVLTSWFTVMAIVEINKVCQQTHRKFSGTDHLTNEQLAERVDRDIATELQSVFGGRFRLEVETTFTDADRRRNYSWSTVVRIGAAGQKTVMTAHVESYRIEDMPA